MTLPSTFKEYYTQIDDLTLSNPRRKMNRKSHKGRHYGGIPGDQSGAPSGMGMEGEEHDEKYVTAPWGGKMVKHGIFPKGRTLKDEEGRRYVRAPWGGKMYLPPEEAAGGENEEYHRSPIGPDRDPQPAPLPPRDARMKKSVAPFSMKKFETGGPGEGGGAFGVPGAAAEEVNVCSHCGQSLDDEMYHDYVGDEEEEYKYWAQSEWDEESEECPMHDEYDERCPYCVTVNQDDENCPYCSDTHANSEEEEEQEADNQEPSLDDMPPEHGDKMPDNELSGGEEMPDEMSDELGDEAGGEAGGETEDDPNKQGMIRTVPGAHLIYKRSNTEGNFEELWIFHISPGVRDEMDIRREVLAGTDIHPEQTRSEDGSQNVEMWAAGNALLMKITGLPN